MSLNALKSSLFPAETRSFTGKRWLDIVLRSFHLVGISGVAAGFLFQIQEADWQLYWYLSITTGVFLSLIHIASNAIWLFQVKGMAIMLKLLLITIASANPEWRQALFISVILLSAVVAHAPGSVRGHMVLFKSLKQTPGC